MGELKYDFSRPELLWGHTDILETDLEKIEYDKNFAGEEGTYYSILDDEPVYHSLMNFPEEEEDALYAEAADDDDDDNNTGSDIEEDDTFDNRNSYRNTDLDNVYYLI
jgi:hypothetical protein